jgi:hypothetical protein
MGYRSDVRIRLTVKDYEKLVKEFNEKIKDSQDGYGYDMFGKDLDVYKEIKNVPCWKVTDDGEDVEETHDCIFFGWNCVKWYDGYKDVDFVMEFLDECDHYAFCRIGESSEGDVETHERNMDMIGFYYAFEEEE